MTVRFRFRRAQKDVTPLSPAAPDFTSLKFHTEKKPMPEYQKAKLPRRQPQNLIRIARNMFLPAWMAGCFLSALVMVGSVAVAQLNPLPPTPQPIAPYTVNPNTGVMTFAQPPLMPSGNPAFSRVVIQSFNASGTYTPTPGMVAAIVECSGSGGGGGGAAASATGNSAGGGGGAGGYSIVAVTAAQIGVSKAVTIGPAGTGGATGNNPGTAGGDASLGTLCVGKGGNGGGGAASNSFGGGATGGSGAAGTGTLTVSGASGSIGIGGSIATIAGVGGMGGGGTQQVGGVSTAQNGTNAAMLSAGGSGGDVNGSGSTAAGGNGAAGYVIVTEFVQ